MIKVDRAARIVKKLWPVSIASCAIIFWNMPLLIAPMSFIMDFLKSTSVLTSSYQVLILNNPAGKKSCKLFMFYFKYQCFTRKFSNVKKDDTVLKSILKTGKHSDNIIWKSIIMHELIDVNHLILSCSNEAD